MNKHLSLFCIILLIALACVVTPLIILGFSNYPSFDDWSMGLFVYKAITKHEGSVFSALLYGFKFMFTTSEPRFSNILFGLVVPSAFGNERFYFVVSFIMLAGLILCQLYYYNAYFRDLRITFVTIAIPLMFQILCVPFPTETFYWYVGSVNYTFINSLSLILIVLFFRLSLSETSGTRHKAVRYIIAILLAILVGGNNFGTSLSRVCLFGIMSLVWLVKDRSKLFRTLPITGAMLISLLICLFSPGSAARLDFEYSEAGLSAVDAILMSIRHTVIAVCGYTDIKMLLTILFCLPFIVMGLQNKKQPGMTFRFPALFTIVTFLLYASELTANYYVEGSLRAQRMADIYFYEYYLFALTNVIYWTGWFLNRFKAVPGKIQSIWDKHPFVYLGTISLCLLLIFAVKDLRLSSTYRASVWLIRGYAAEYKEAWEERLALLKDPAIRNVSFDPIDLPHELIYYADITEDPNAWLNLKIAEYYGKDSVAIKSNEE